MESGPFVSRVVIRGDSFEADVTIGPVVATRYFGREEHVDHLREHFDAINAYVLSVVRTDIGRRWSLRNPEDKGRAWEDLCLAREVLEAAV